MSKPMKLNIHLFARLKELAGGSPISVEVSSPATIQTVRETVIAAYPVLTDALPSAIAALNHEYIDDAQAVTATDEVAFFMPVSGG